MIADKAHPTTGDCSVCHKRTDYFEGVLKPNNHIPTATSAACADCPQEHRLVGAAVGHRHTRARAEHQRQLRAVPRQRAAASFAIPAANFAIVGVPTGHIPTNAACETCHVGAGSSVAATPVKDGAKFSNSARTTRASRPASAATDPTSRARRSRASRVS